jgi:hypothetical protein
MAVDVLLDAPAVAPLPPSDTGDAAVGGAAVAVISDVVGENVVSRIAQMLLLDHEVDLDGVVDTPGLAKVPRKNLRDTSGERD